LIEGTMAKVIHKLTAQQIKAASKPGYLGDGGNLYLQISQSGTKSWVLRYEQYGRRHEMGLGPLALVSLPEARERAIAARKQLLNGIDPIQAKAAQRRAAIAEAAKNLNFGEAARQYIAAQRAGWKNDKHAYQWTMTLLGHDKNGKQSAIDYCKSLRSMPVASIETSDVVRVLSPIWTSKNETAVRIRARIESVLDWAEASGYRTGKNPAAWKGGLDNLMPSRSKIQKVRQVQRQPALPYAQTPTFVRDLRTQDGVAPLAMEFLILTAVRLGNVLRARWSQIDLQAATWTIAASEMKSNVEHVVPLSKAALAVLERAQAFKISDAVFPGGTKGLLPDAALTDVIQRMNKIEKRWVDPTTGRAAVPHGFRSAFRDWAAENGVADAVAEACLAHKVSSAVVRAYQRTTFVQLRAKAMEQWSNYVDRPAGNAVVLTLYAGKLL